MKDKIKILINSMRSGLGGGPTISWLSNQPQEKQDTFNKAIEQGYLAIENNCIRLTSKSKEIPLE